MVSDDTIHMVTRIPPKTAPNETAKPCQNQVPITEGDGGSLLIMHPNEQTPVDV